MTKLSRLQEEFSKQARQFNDPNYSIGSEEIMDLDCGRFPRFFST